MQVYFWLCRAQTKTMSGEIKIRDFYTEFKPRHNSIRELVAQNHPSEKFMGVMDKISVRVSLSLDIFTGGLKVERRVMLNEKDA